MFWSNQWGKGWFCVSEKDEPVVIINLDRVLYIDESGHHMDSGEVLQTNAPLKKTAQHLGFCLGPEPDDKPTKKKCGWTHLPDP